MMSLASSFSHTLPTLSLLTLLHLLHNIFCIVSPARHRMLTNATLSTSISN